MFTLNGRKIMFNWLRDRARLALQDEIKSVRTDLNMLASEIELLRTNISSLRGSFNQRMRKGNKANTGNDEDDLAGADRLPTNTEELRELLRKEYGIF